MEHAFNLNQAIRDWRAGLSTFPAVQPEGLDELESHLKDSISALMEKSLSEEEAFLVAVHRCGSHKQLRIEFSKAGLTETLLQIWFFRTAWILLGLLFSITVFSIWRGDANVWHIYPIFGLEIPKYMLVGLGIAGLNALQLRSLAKLEIQHSIFSFLHWFLLALFSATLIIAFNPVFDILCGAFLHFGGRGRYLIPPGFSGGPGLLIWGFFVPQAFMALVLLALSGAARCFKPIIRHQVQSDVVR